MKKKWFLFICLVLVITSFTACNGTNLDFETSTIGADEESKLMLVLDLYEYSYKLDEPIEANLSLSNQGAANVTVNARLAANFSSAPEIIRDIEFVITTPSNGLAVFDVNVNVLQLSDDFFQLLLPGETIQISYDLQNYYVLEETGSYLIFAIYQNKFDPQKGSAAWKGELTSNTVSFEITP